MSNSEQIIMYPEAMELWTIHEESSASEYLNGEPVKRRPDVQMVIGELHEDEGVRYILAGEHREEWPEVSPDLDSSWQYVTALYKPGRPGYLYFEENRYYGDGWHSIDDGIMAMCDRLNNRLEARKIRKDAA